MHESKKCFKCLLLLSFDNFYAHPRMADGHLGKCKDCAKADQKSYVASHKESVKRYEATRSKTEKRIAAAKAYQATPTGKDVQLRAAIATNTRFPGRAAARTKVRNALRDGLISKEPCFICGDKAEAHHPDYSSPLAVTWLCKKHHVEAHQLAKKIDHKLITQPF